MSENTTDQQLKEYQINFDNLPKVDMSMANIDKSLLSGHNDVEALLKAFAQYLEISKRVTSANTKSTYISNTRQFLVWCNRLGFPISNVTKTLVLRNLIICYEKALSSTDLAQNSRALKQSSVKKFFEWYSFMHEDYGIIVHKCFSPDWVSSADSGAYMKQTRINKEVFDAIRDQAYLGDVNDKWIFFLLAFGCRRSEIVSLRVTDIDFLNKCINVYQVKQKTVKKLPLPIWATSEDVVIKTHTYLIYNKSKRSSKTKGLKMVTTQYIYSKILKWREKTDYKAVAITPHSFRRYFINNLLKQGASDSNIAKLSGHSSLNMIQKYGYDISLDNNPIINNNQVQY